jgi:dTMP kinase
MMEKTMTFISLDGGEGVGKSTQMQLLAEGLPRLFPEREFVFTREPGGTPLGEKIRSLIFQAENADGLTMFGLFAASRADHVRRVIRPALEAGKVVITDRFAAASWAYQMYAQENPIPGKLFDAHLESLGIFPDLTIILDMEPDESQARVNARKGESTHFDTRSLSFHQKLRFGYEQFARTYGYDVYRVALVDASRSIEEVHTDILQLIHKLLR